VNQSTSQPVNQVTGGGGIEAWAKAENRPESTFFFAYSLDLPTPLFPVDTGYQVSQVPITKCDECEVSYLGERL
jgi:hypothetical protein